MKTISILMMIFIILLSILSSKALSQVGKNYSKVIIMDENRVKVDIKSFNVRNNNCTIQIKVSNFSESDFYLYLPLLDSLHKCTKVLYVYDSLDNLLNYSGNVKSRYYSGDDNSLPIIKPKINSKNLLLLKQDSSICFSINLLKYYNVLPSKKYSVRYFSLMPLINKNRKMIYQVDSMDLKRKPVFIALKSDMNYIKT